MGTLYPVFPDPSLYQPGEQRGGPAYTSAPRFDFASGDFAVDGAGRVILDDGSSAWAAWCVKAVQTERLAFLAYDHAYGCDLASVQGSVSRAVAQANAERAITEALMADPRTSLVRDFSFVWSGDSLQLSFTAVPTVGAPQRLEVSMNHG